MDIVFVISHKPDIRYQKRLTVLANSFDTAIVYWNKDEKPVGFSYNKVTSYEIQVPANKTDPLKRLPQTFEFIKKAYRKICEIRPECVFVGNLDMLLVAAKYKSKNPKAKIIYEIADLHRLIADNQKTVIKKLVSIVLRKTEKTLSKYINLLILTSMKFYDIYYKEFIDEKKVVLMPNIPDEEAFEGFSKKIHSSFIIGFVGAIRYKNQLRMLIEATKDTGIKVLFAGSDGEGPEFRKECSKYDHVNFTGEFDYKKDIQSIYQSIDCVYAVYDADMVNVRVALPNKLYEAIICEVPIIVAKGTYLAELVEGMCIGIAVNHKDVDELKRKLLKIANDRAYYKRFCENCRKQQKNYHLVNYNNEMLFNIAKLLYEEE